MSRHSIATILLLGSLAACSKAPTGEESGTPAASAVETLSSAKFVDFKGDPGAGEAIFAQCKACHAIEPGVNRSGPSLHGVVGRKAGIIDGFHYSPAIRNSGIVWSEPKLFEFLESPRHVVPGTMMGFGGLGDPQKRADVIAYLKANGS
ncbi:MAG: cytochrome c family protein [Sphingomonadales bacterium]|nr:cytochrome c family protein [Sphingomonadales bacterium]